MLGWALGRVGCWVGWFECWVVGYRVDRFITVQIKVFVFRLILFCRV